jgi:hypothetical protein
MIFKIKARLMLLGLPLAMWGAGAQATDFFCNNFIAGDHPQHYQCVQTTVGPGTPLIISPDQAGGGIPLVASSVSAGSGSFASTSSANASASPGLLRGYASAEMLGGSSDTASAAARSDAWFSDGGTVVGGPGSAIGDPVSLRFSISIVGGFSGGAKSTSLSEARADLSVGGPRAISFQTGSRIDKFNNVGLVTTDVNALVGDSFEMIMKLHVAANAVNPLAANQKAVADVSNTGHLYVDVLSGNAAFIGSTGHAYATPAPVPEPSTYAMLLSGLLLTGALAGRRQRRYREKD